MWGTLLIIDRLILPASPADLRAKEDDKLVLTWEQRRWVRGRFTTDKGRKIGLALPTGTTLAPDAILWVEQDWYLRVEAATESVLEILPSDYEEAVKIAFEVGNRHFPLALQGNKLLVPDDKAMVRLMDRLGAPWETRQAVFNPIGSAQGHQHG
ncbi:MAG TPA: urease accessory protein UreE [Candidatus Dormibacteraeota bacterium]|nr:urease accessory protein UreE [Candidatus Dormibacteraeota bacterium]